MSTMDPELARYRLSELRCRDDALSPEPDWVLCTKPDLHDDKHVAAELKPDGTSNTLRSWDRGKGRAAGELRVRLGMSPYR